MIAQDKQLVVVAFQAHNVPGKTADHQWNRLVEKVVRPIYNAMTD